MNNSRSKSILKPILFHGRQALRDVSNKRSRYIYFNLPGTKTFDPFALVRLTDHGARRLQRIATSIKKSSRRASPRRTRVNTGAPLPVPGGP